MTQLAQAPAARIADSEALNKYGQVNWFGYLGLKRSSGCRADDRTAALRALEAEEAGEQFEDDDPDADADFDDFDDDEPDYGPSAASLRPPVAARPTPAMAPKPQPVEHLAYRYTEVSAAALDAVTPGPKRALAGLTWLKSWSGWAEWALAASSHRLGSEPPRLRYFRAAGPADTVAFSRDQAVAGTYAGLGSRDIWVSANPTDWLGNPHLLASLIAHEVHHYATDGKHHRDEGERLAEEFGAQFERLAHGLWN